MTEAVLDKTGAGMIVNTIVNNMHSMSNFEDYVLQQSLRENEWISKWLI